MHFERDESGDLVRHPGDDEDAVQPGSPIPSKTIEETMEDLTTMKRRNLDQWCFAEHLEPAVFLQVEYCPERFCNSRQQHIFCTVHIKAMIIIHRSEHP